MWMCDGKEMINVRFTEPSLCKQFYRWGKIHTFELPVYLFMAFYSAVEGGKMWAIHDEWTKIIITEWILTFDFDWKQKCRIVSGMHASILTVKTLNLSIFSFETQIIIQEIKRSSSDLLRLNDFSIPRII